MELPVLGEIGLLNAGIVGCTLLAALLLHLSMNAGGSSAGTRLDDGAFESLINGTDADGADGDENGGGGWDDDGEVEIQKTTLADARADSARLEAAQKLMAAKAQEAAEAKAKAAKAGGQAMAVPQKVQAGPYKIGDRVVLQNLQSATDLNGRHGTIADTWDGSAASQQRYPVDLDLYDPRKGGAVAVQVANLTKEAAIPAAFEESRAPVSNGVLSEEHGRAVSFLHSTMRQSVVKSLLTRAGGTDDSKRQKQIATDPKQVAQFCWTFWKTPNGKGVYPSLVQYLTRDILVTNKLEDLEKQLNPASPRGAYKLIRDATTDRRAVASWDQRISGEFWIMGGNAQGTIVVPASNSRAVYCVAGLKLPLAVQIMQQTKVPRPPKFNLTLLPWYGRLVHDPFLSTTAPDGGRIEVASPQKTQELMRAVQIATAEKRVVYRLRQAEVEGGSACRGIPFVPFQELNQTSAPAEPPAPKEQGPATEEERGLIDDVAMYEAHPLQPPGPSGHPPPLAAWNFIRKGASEEDNPDHALLVVAANGQQIDAFQCQGNDPTAAEILKKMLGIAAKGVGGRAETMGKRPSVVGVDCRETVERLQFLLKDTKDIRVVLIQVTRKPRGADGQPVEPKRNDLEVE